MTDWGLVHSETSPLVATWTGSAKRVWGEIELETPMTPEELLTSASNYLAADGNLIVLAVSLWSPGGTEESGNSYYVDFTTAPNPAIHTSGTVEPALWGALLGGLAAFLGLEFIAKGSDSTIGGIGDLLNSIMPLMLMMMIMPMMTNMFKGSSKESSGNGGDTKIIIIDDDDDNDYMMDREDWSRR